MNYHTTKVGECSLTAEFYCHDGQKLRMHGPYMCEAVPEEIEIVAIRTAHGDDIWDVADLYARDLFTRIENEIRVQINAVQWDEDESNTRRSA